eukprot:14299163-Ditylum_brightwellii.AAC.1
MDGKWYYCFASGNIGGKIKGNGAGTINITINFGNGERGMSDIKGLGLVEREVVWQPFCWRD